MCAQLLKWLPNIPSSLAATHLHEDLMQTRNHNRTAPKTHSFYQLALLSHFSQPIWRPLMTTTWCPARYFL